MSADTLRKAAELMRERAEAVPATWHLCRSQIIATGTEALAGTDVIATCMVPEQASYVASMHPGVALAIANWLLVKAANLEVAAVMPATRDHDYGYALEVARAYLGESA